MRRHKSVTKALQKGIYPVISLIDKKAQHIENISFLIP